MYFHAKLAWPPATYDVIARNHSNWPSLNLSCPLCARDEWTASENVRHLCFSLQEKTQKNLIWGGQPRSQGAFPWLWKWGPRNAPWGRGWRVASPPSTPPPPPLLVRPRVKRFYCLFWSILNGVTLKTSNSIPSHNGKLDFKKRTHEK